MIESLISRRDNWKASLARFEAGKFPIIAHIVLLALATLPFFRGGAFALVDLAGGIGRQALNIRLFQSPENSAFYDFKIRLIPNMALDIWGIVVGQVVGPERAVNLFIVMVIVLYYCSIQLLHLVVHGRFSVFVGAISIFVITALPFQMGFANYMFGTSIMIFAISHFERHLQQPIQSRRQNYFNALQTCLVVIMTLSSIFPVMLYLCYLAGRVIPELLGHCRERKFDRVATAIGEHAASLVAIVLILGFADLAHTIGDTRTEWTLNSKLLALSSLLVVVKSPTEFISALLLYGVLFVVWKRERPRLPSQFIVPAALMLALFLLLPSYLQGVAFVDTRLPQAIAAVLLPLVTGIRPVSDEVVTPERPSRSSVLVAILVLAAVIKIGTIFELVSRRTPLREDISTVLAAVPQGSKILLAGEQTFEFRTFAPSAFFLHALAGDYYLSSLINNIFVNYKNPRAADSIIGLLSLEVIPVSVVCSGFSHVLVLGDDIRFVKDFPLLHVAEKNALHLYKVQKEQGGMAEKSCPHGN